MLSILCIDDDPVFLKKIKRHLEDKDVRIYAYSSFPETIPDVDGCFLDVEVCGDNSIEWAKQLDGVPIVFISHYDQYVFEAVKLRVFDYIRKSNFEEEIEQTIQTLLQYLYNQKDFLSLKYKGIDYRISIMNIEYIETYSHQCFIHMLNKEIFEFKKDFQSLNITAPYFIKTHHAYIINLYHCSSIYNRKAYLKNDIAIPISYRRYKSVVQEFHSIYTKSL